MPTEADDRERGKRRSLRLPSGVFGTKIVLTRRRREQVMPAGGTNNVSPWLLPGVILGGVLLLIGGITTGSVSTVILAFVATGVLAWTIVRRNRA
ncbi:hypothetical protein ABH926_004422 [Catenulispora sp. GP43]|uniref:hypothetical protein n=1 Tax=Catenulispora sp. GP43 TaxID=3156263 RepID=UPI0035148B49